jgi:dinuclear metal center YbgI/SA1388 family protein
VAERDAIVSLLDQTLRTKEIKDSSCNGLQVQGAGAVRRVGLAVDACLEAYEKAAAAGCQMVIVHHGLIWNGLKSVTGRNYQHVRFLIEHGLNLYAAHLPLDMHEEYGNNIALARMLELRDVQPFGDYHEMLIGYQGRLPRPTTPAEIARQLAGKLGGKPVVLPNGPAQVRSVGIVSGGAGDMIEQAADAQLDCYVTGEPLHFTYQLAREVGANVIYLGHYHSETLGVQAVGRLLTERLGVESVFLDIAAFSAGDYTD